MDKYKLRSEFLARISQICVFCNYLVLIVSPYDVMQYNYCIIRNVSCKHYFHNEHCLLLTTI